MAAAMVVPVVVMVVFGVGLAVLAAVMMCSHASDIVLDISEVKIYRDIISSSPCP
jgi:hypothetical protein